MSERSSLLMVLGEGDSIAIEVPPGTQCNTVQVTMLEKVGSGSGRRAKLRVVADKDVKLHRVRKDSLQPA